MFMNRRANIEQVVMKRQDESRQRQFVRQEILNAAIELLERRSPNKHQTRRTARTLRQRITI
jgi:hypothetical protein